MTQRHFNFDPPSPRSGPETSREAAASMRPHASRLAMKVLDYIRARGRVTCAGIEIGLGMSHQTVSARIWELRRAGLVRDTEDRAFTPSGRRAALWEATSKERSANDATG